MEINEGSKLHGFLRIFLGLRKGFKGLSIEGCQFPKRGIFLYEWQNILMFFAYLKIY
jgi:hypothetical protein